MTHRSSTWLRRVSGVAAVATTMFVAACADAPTSPSPSLRANPEEQPPRYVTVCKDGPAGTYTFEAYSVSGSGTFVAGTPIPPSYGTAAIQFSLTAGSCLDIYTPGTVLEQLRVAEVNLPTGVTLEKITWQTLAWLGNPDGPINTLVGVNSVDLEPFSKPIRVTFYNKAPDLPGTQGCTPGFWKNSTGSWPATGISTGADFDATFGVNAFDPNISLLKAVGLGGGGINALARHAVAALLNAAHPGVDYPLTQAQVIAGVQNAIATGTVESYKNTLVANNELGCGLANDNSFK